VNELKWFSQYEQIIKNLFQEKIKYLIVPFIQLHTLEKLISENLFIQDCIVITRWNKEDLISGVSDINIYPYLKDRKITLYINKNLHLKMYVNCSNTAYISSGNLTSSGMGINTSGNIEIGAFHDLTEFDNNMINQLIFDSTLVNDSLFDILKIALKNTDSPNLKGDDWDIYKNGSISIHKSQTPELYLNSYMTNDYNDKNFIHDTFLFSIPMGLEKDEVTNLLKSKFCSNTVMVEVIEYIRADSPIGFGERPQYEGVQNGTLRKFMSRKYPGLDNDHAFVNSLQDWLPFCKPEINVSVTIPGRNSRVFTWID